jgi:hypothetical protein
VIEVVGDNFLDIVMDEDVDVLLEMYDGSGYAEHPYLSAYQDFAR